MKNDCLMLAASALFASLMLIAGCGRARQNGGSDYKADVIIYGGTPAALALEKGKSIYNISYPEIEGRLVENGQVIRK